MYICRVTHAGLSHTPLKCAYAIIKGRCFCTVISVPCTSPIHFMNWLSELAGLLSLTGLTSLLPRDLSSANRIQIGFHGLLLQSCCKFDHGTFVILIDRCILGLTFKFLMRCLQILNQSCQISSFTRSKMFCEIINKSYWNATRLFKYVIFMPYKDSLHYFYGEYISRGG